MKDENEMTHYAIVVFGALRLRREEFKKEAVNIMADGAVVGSRCHTPSSNGRPSRLLRGWMSTSP